MAQLVSKRVVAFSAAPTPPSAPKSKWGLLKTTVRASAQLRKNKSDLSWEDHDLLFDHTNFKTDRSNFEKVREHVVATLSLPAAERNEAQIDEIMHTTRDVRFLKHQEEGIHRAVCRHMTCTCKALASLPSLVLCTGS